MSGGILKLENLRPGPGQTLSEFPYIKPKLDETMPCKLIELLGEPNRDENDQILIEGMTELLENIKERRKGRKGLGFCCCFHNWKPCHGNIPSVTAPTVTFHLTLPNEALYIFTCYVLSSCLFSFKNLHVDSHTVIHGVATPI